jgi:hypothetical protein
MQQTTRGYTTRLHGEVRSFMCNVCWALFHVELSIVSQA